MAIFQTLFRYILPTGCHWPQRHRNIWHRQGEDTYLTLIHIQKCVEWRSSSLRCQIRSRPTMIQSRQVPSWDSMRQASRSQLPKTPLAKRALREPHTHMELEGAIHLAVVVVVVDEDITPSAVAIDLAEEVIPLPITPGSIAIPNRSTATVHLVCRYANLTRRPTHTCGQTSILRVVVRHTRDRTSKT